MYTKEFAWMMGWWDYYTPRYRGEFMLGSLDEYWPFPELCDAYTEGWETALALNMVELT